MRLSIIVPIYNTENYIERCIESLLNKDLKNYEIILVNDGSTDNSEKKVEKYLKEPNIRYFSKKNGGVSSARNYGIEVSKGKYIGFVDSDDFIEKNMFRKMLIEAEKNDSDIVICGLKKVDEKNNILESYIPQSNKFREILINAYSCNKIFKKNKFEKNKFPINKYYEDKFIIPIIALESSKINIVKEALYNYFIGRSDQITNSKDDFKIFDLIEAHKNIEIYLKKINSKELKCFNQEKLKFKNNFLLKIISGYSHKFIVKNASKIILEFKELEIWNPMDYFKLILAFLLPKRIIKKIKNNLIRRKV